MGELILCSQQLAAMPYYIENVSLNVYSLDELCYYIKNNTCLLDADFMDDELCDWVENEQHLPDIAQNLRNIKAGGGVLSEFTGCNATDGWRSVAQSWYRICEAVFV